MQVELTVDCFRYLIPLTIGPAFLTASIYLCLSRIVIVYGQSLSRLTPRILSLTFVCLDIISLILQAAGGALAASADDNSSSDTGRYIMIAGLAWQVVSLAVFMLIWVDFIWRVRNTPEESRHSELHYLRIGVRRFRYFQFALWLATILIFIRSIYRVVELQGGFNGAVANNQAAFMVLEGPMIILATAALTFFHPGYSFAGHWADASWSLRGREATAVGSSSSSEIPLSARK